MRTVLFTVEHTKKPIVLCAAHESRVRGLMRAERGRDYTCSLSPLGGCSEIPDPPSSERLPLPHQVLAEHLWAR